MIRSCQRRKLGSDVVYSLSCVWLFAAPWIAARQASPSPEVCPSSCPLHWWCHPAILSSDALFFCPQSFLASGTFPISQLFTSDDQNTRVSTSASVLPTSIQDWFPISLTGLISLLSKGLSEVFSTPIVWRHRLFGAPPRLQASSHNCTWPLERERKK